MKATELNIDVVYQSPYWVVLFERISNNRRALARRILGRQEPQHSDLSKFFESLDYKKLRYRLA